MNRILKFLFNLNTNIRKSYKREESLFSSLYEDRENGLLEEEMEEYYFVTYNDYERLRILMINVLFFIIKDIKMKQRKYKEKIKSLMEEINNTYFYFSYPTDKYLIDFQKMVYGLLFRYYKDYKYKAKIEYDKYEIQFAACASQEEDSKTIEFSFDPFQLKNLFIYYKFIR